MPGCVFNHPRLSAQPHPFRFVMNAAFDVYQVQHILDVGCVPSKCTAAQIAAMEKYVKPLALNPFIQLHFPSITPTIHVYPDNIPLYNSILLSFLKIIYPISLYKVLV